MDNPETTNPILQDVIKRLRKGEKMTEEGKAILQINSAKLREALNKK